MTGLGDPEAAFEADWKREVALRRGIDIGAWVVSLSTVATLLTLIIPLGRTSPWLPALSLYAIATRLATLLSWKAFLYPRFLLRLEDRDATRASAARAVLERRREEIVKPILADLLRPCDPAAIAALAPEALAALAREHGIDARRRLLLVCFVAWLLVSVTVWSTVIATGGGPTN